MRTTRRARSSSGEWTRLAISSRAEAIGDYGEKRVSSFLEDLDCEDYRVYNDLLIRNGNYTTQVDHIVISRYGVFVLETKNVHGKVYGGGNAEFWKQYLPDTGHKQLAVMGICIDKNISICKNLFPAALEHSISI